LNDPAPGDWRIENAHRTQPLSALPFAAAEALAEATAKKAPSDNMLILPLHHPLDVRHLPWATLGLILLNLFVFIVLQAGDPAREAHARERYVASGLAALEVDAWLAYPDAQRPARAQAQIERLREAPEPLRSMQLSELIDLDRGFQRSLAEGASLTDPAAWRALRDAHEAALAHSFTWRYQVQSQSFDPARLIGSAFLHGGVGHLFGNLLFLLLLGMLVEGAVGARLLVLLYVLGAIGSSLASLAWHWGEAHAGLGASGAVAALMGAYSWIWGLRPVRFFYWFFVVFDYVRAPALLLFPAWLGWEVWNLLINPDAGIGFDAHAGGLLTGAVFALAVSRFGGVCEDFIELSDSHDRERASALLTEAEQEIGRLELSKCRSQPRCAGRRRRGPRSISTRPYRALPRGPLWQPHAAGRRTAVRAVGLARCRAFDPRRPAEGSRQRQPAGERRSPDRGIRAPASGRRLRACPCPAA
jgi:membrane associated rhomboid family serine protease